MTRPGRVPVLFALVVMIVLLVSACGSADAPGTGGSAASTAAGRVIRVVAAENFYGDIVRQLGGKHVAVTSLLSNPNVDPHEYSSSVRDAEAVSDADIVVKNGGGYDDWMDKLLSATPNSERTVLSGFDLATTKLPDNEHVWYSIDNIKGIATAITGALKAKDAADASTFAHNLQTFTQSLQPIQQKMDEIKQKYAGTPVGLTETIFLYQSGPLGLKMMTPFAFQKAIAEGNDPPADLVATVNEQISQGQIKVLIYNAQTVTPVTTKLQNDASARHIPIVPVTETMPIGQTYQQWMLGQLNALEQALQSSTGR
jgi:zinc/manganese transport system substrate-binding protein